MTILYFEGRMNFQVNLMEWKLRVRELRMSFVILFPHENKFLN